MSERSGESEIDEGPMMDRSMQHDLLGQALKVNRYDVAHLESRTDEKSYTIKTP